VDCAVRPLRHPRGGSLFRWTSQRSALYIKAKVRCRRKVSASPPEQSWSPPMRLLLLLPFIGLLWVPFYNFENPTLFGFPFFYWYQLMWVPITSLLIWLVYRSRTNDEAR
jgi:hypothetical protein